MHYLLSYELKDGRHARLFNHDLLQTDKNGSYPRKSTEVTMYDANGECTYVEFYVDILKDQENGKLYFVIDDEKKYISDFEYLEANDLVDKIRNNEKIPAYLFIASLIKNYDKIAFIEERPVPNYMLSGITRIYPVEKEKKYKRILCEPIAKFHEKEDWFYKIETVPVSESEKEIYGRAEYEIESFYSSILNRDNSIILKKDINNYDFSNQIPYRRKRTRN